MHGISVQFSVSFGYPFEGYDGEQDADESKSHEHTLDTNVCIHEASQLKRNLCYQLVEIKIVNLNLKYTNMYPNDLFHIVQ